MKQNTAAFKAMASIQAQIEITEGQWNTIYEHLLLMYAVGFDTGRCQTAHEKPVVAYKNGVFIQKYDSVTAAAHALGVDKTSVSKNVRGKTSNCQGFNFQFCE